MHGTAYRNSESCRSLRRSGSQPMRSALHFLPSDTAGTNLSSADDHHSSIASSPATNTATTTDSFFKDDRKVSVGDCALFKPSQDSPPFIGLIRCLNFREGNSLQLGVNWLYRPAEIKLGKGTLLDSAPNEIFYSFHEDKIPAASLLHPCKVAFLPRGVELPTGTLAFVCRRVYDIANKCLWWLTDRDYINERQEEVDLLLRKTKTEMHATLQPGDRSPKQVNSPSSTAKLKPGSDNGQSTGTSFPSHVKGKKRERGDYGADTVKRERSSKTDDGGHVQSKPVTNLKSEIARITEKGGVADLDGVEKLIHLMQSNKMERNRDLLNRSMLAGVMAATDKVECLSGFVQLKGLPILDEWLQDIHKGKNGDGYSLRDGDKSVEEFLLVLLRALDKLPVNLNALQMCNIGRSVNHLRSHKNLEIQRKARSLVDTWKKRVEAEMISIDTKSGSTQDICVWTSKSRLSEASHGGSKTPTGSDVAMKRSVTQSSASKTTSARSSHGDCNIKSTTSSPEPLKSASSPASGKEGLPRVSVGGTPEVPLIREDRSSSSNQPNNCSQSFSSKEDEKSSSMGLTTVCKISNSTIRNRKISGLSGGSVSGSQKETSSGRVSSVHKNIVLEKSQSASSDRIPEVPITEGSSHKLIVKIPNQIRSPSHGVSGKTLEDPTFISSRDSSEVLLDKHELLDQASKDKSDANEFNVDSKMNVESWQSSDIKDLLIESREGSRSPEALPDEEHSMTTKDSPTNQLIASKLQESSLNSMNALIESCAKYSAGNSSLSVEDEVGMNLLASVATREMPRFDVVSPTDSTEIITHTVVENCVADEAKSKSSPENYISADRSQLSIDDDCDDKKQVALDGGSFPVDGFHRKVSVKFDDVVQCAPFPSSEDVPAGGVRKHTVSSSTGLRKSVDSECRINEICNEKAGTLKFLISTEKVADGQLIEQIHEEKPTSSNPNSNGAFNCTSEEISVKVTEEKSGTTLGEGKPTAEITESNKLCECKDIKDSIEELNTGTNVQQKAAAIVKPEFSEKENNAKLPQNAYGQNSVLDGNAEVNFGEPDKYNADRCIDEPERLNSDEEVIRDADVKGDMVAGFCSTSIDQKGHKETNVDKMKVVEHMSLAESVCFGSVKHEADQNVELEGSVPVNIQLDEAKKCDTAVVEACSSDTKEIVQNSKLNFDLNEGFSVDDGKCGEPVHLISSISTTVYPCSSVPFSLNSAPAGHSAFITVAAAAKGPFVPPEDLMKSKQELGWKGSAATSAFRPAEPRKSLETPFGSTNSPYSDTSTNKNTRLLLDVDLNVPDERVIEEMASQDSALTVDSTTDYVSKHAPLLNEAPGFLLVRDSGGMDLDLNRVDETNDNAHFTISSNYHKRDFDLNDGPVVDNANVEHLLIGKKVNGGIPSQLPSSGLRINSPGMGNFPSWFPPGNTCSTGAIPSILPDQGGQPFSIFPPSASQRTFGPIGVTPFTQDLYRGPVLSSSPAVPYPSSHFQFPVFPFGATFPHPSATFSVGASSYADSSSGARLFTPAINSQFLGPVGSVASQFMRPYMVNLPDRSCNGVLENDRKWGKPGLDLNAGPGAMESEIREESSAQYPVASQAAAEEQSWSQSASGGISKRKEPEGGRDNETVRYKPFSWQ